MISETWRTMNDLEMTTSKIVCAREIIDAAISAIQQNDCNKAETLAMAAYEFLDYYLSDFDEKFKLAWKETVTKEKDARDRMPSWGHSDLEHTSKVCDTNDTSEYCNSAWDDFWNNDDEAEDLTETEESSDKWTIPVEEDNVNGDLFITLPNDLLERMGWGENDTLEWISNQDGSWTLKKNN